MITIETSALYQTTTTIIVTQKSILLVDPNWLPIEIKRIREKIVPYLSGRQLYLLFTHSDYDHIIGYNAFPEALVIASRAFADNPEKEKSVEDIKVFDDTNYILRKYEIAYPKVDIIVEDTGQELILGDLELTCYNAPGHNRDGIFTIVENNGTWIAGDYLSDIEFPFIYHSSSDYLNTLGLVDLIIDYHNIQMLVPGHGTPTTSISEIKRRKLENQKYILELKNAARTRNDFNLDALWERYRFRRGMEVAHMKNVALIRDEVAINSGKNVEKVK